jgi:hypothetical protein
MPLGEQLPGRHTPSPQVSSDVQALGEQSGTAGWVQMTSRSLHLAGAVVGRSPQQSSSVEQSTRSQCMALTSISNSFLAHSPFKQARPASQSLRA